MSAACPYETDVTDAQWDILPPLLPKETWTPGSRGRPPCPLRREGNGMLYVNKTGCQWRMRPKDFGPWETVYGYLRRWRRAGVWERVMTDLHQVVRRCQGRLGEPSAGAIVSQSVKTATQSKEVGCDGNKKIQGRQRHLLVATLGLIVAVVVTAASVDDRLGLMALWHHYRAAGVTRLPHLGGERGDTPAEALGGSGLPWGMAARVGVELKAHA